MSATAAGSHNNKSSWLFLQDMWFLPSCDLSAHGVWVLHRQKMLAAGDRDGADFSCPIIKTKQNFCMIEINIHLCCCVVY